MDVSYVFKKGFHYSCHGCNICNRQQHYYAANPWMQTFSPSRVLYVSSGGVGTGLAKTVPMSFTKALNQAKAGDLYWLLGGTYQGQFVCSHNGTAAKPIVFRAMKGERVTIQGTIEMSGTNTWLWGVEVTDPNNIGKIVGSGFKSLPQAFT